MSTTSSRYRKPIIEQFEDRRLLAIDIDLDQTTGPTIEQYGWDIKGGANIRDRIGIIRRERIFFECRSFRLPTIKTVPLTSPIMPTSCATLTSSAIPILR
jgi:hypothetical protein